jgi:hypothetical protein
MIQVNTDNEQKLVDVVITGFVKVEEAMQVSSDLKRTLGQFGPQEAVLLIDLVGFAPRSNDVLPILRGMGRDVVSFFRKTALVQEFGMEYGGRRVIEGPPGSKLPTYPSRDAALKYLLE